MTVFTKCKNLSNYLCRSSSPGEVQAGTIDASLNTPPLEQRVDPCGHAYSKCCQQLFQTHSLAGIPLTQHLNCRTKNVVYMIKCKQHPRYFYIGQTSRQLNHRLSNHRVSFLNPGTKANWPIYRHFFNTNHVKEDMLTSPLVSCPRVIYSPLRPNGSTDWIPTGGPA